MKSVRQQLSGMVETVRNGSGDGVEHFRAVVASVVCGGAEDGIEEERR